MLCMTWPNSWKNVLTCLCVSREGFFVLCSLSNEGLGKLQTRAATFGRLLPELSIIPWKIGGFSDTNSSNGTTEIISELADTE